MPPNYQKIGTETVVTLKDNEYVQWTEGYEIPENYTLRIWGLFGDSLGDVIKNKLPTKYFPTAFLTNAQKNYIEVGIRYDLTYAGTNPGFSIKMTPCLTVKQTTTDVHGYELTGDTVNLGEENIDWVLTLKCINNLYSISLSKQTTTGGTT